MKSRQAVVDLIKTWEGKKESDGSYKYIIDIYNSYKGTLPRGLKMQYGWSWCACTWSALAILLDYTSIMPIEISCGNLVEEAKKMGVWREDDAYVAQPGDAVLYDWGDSGSGDNAGWPDHVGTIIETNEAAGYFVVMEGNYNDSVKKRTLPINGKFIRGFITPKYDDNAKYYAPASAATTTTGREQNSNQKAVKKVTATCTAKKFDKNLAGTYKTTANLYCRNGAGTNKKALCLIPKGTSVRCYGYYNLSGKDKWLYVQAVVDGIQYTGFCSADYLRK